MDIKSPGLIVSPSIIIFQNQILLFYYHLHVALKDGNSIHLAKIEPQHQPRHHVGWMVMWSGNIFLFYSCLIANHSDWLVCTNHSHVYLVPT
jgi:hypothetical protein